MRLWHKNLIEVLPRQQLLGQWRECCAIAKSIAETGTPNHLLVNKIIDYPLQQFYNYGLLVAQEMIKRDYKVDIENFVKYFPNILRIKTDKMFEGWHDDRYLMQCYYNLQEKFDCGGIIFDEWKMIERKVNNG